MLELIYIYIYILSTHITCGKVCVCVCVYVCVFWLFRFVFPPVGFVARCFLRLVTSVLLFCFCRFAMFPIVAVALLCSSALACLAFCIGVVFSFLCFDGFASAASCTYAHVPFACWAFTLKRAYIVCCEDQVSTLKSATSGGF